MTGRSTSALRRPARLLRSLAPKLVLLGALLLASCGPRPPTFLPLPEAPVEPPPSQVESVVFLFGDAGDVRDDHSPMLARLGQDIERWSASLSSDSAVTVVVLGDIVYPEGIRPPDTERFHADTAVLMSQVRLVEGPAARRHGARAFFLAGNHDWGRRQDWAGYVRLANLEDVLEQARATLGVAAALVPAAGTGGPYVVDVGAHLRIVMLDTAWWLLESGGPTHREVLAGIEQAIATAGAREILIAAHHPFRSGGPHGGRFSFWRTAGARYLLFRSGALLQDLSSAPYRDLQNGLRAIFARHGRPLVFAGGHEHSLQVIAGVQATDPLFNLVSGAGSKLTDVGDADGLHFARSAPGYMRLIVERNGGVTLFVESTGAEYLKCPERDPEREQCMAAGAAAFRLVYAQRLR
jgi:hypothetical protein